MMRAPSLLFRQLQSLHTPGAALRTKCGFSKISPASAGRLSSASLAPGQAHLGWRDELRCPRDLVTKTWGFVSNDFAAAHRLRIPIARVSPSAIASARYATASASVDGGNGSSGKQGGDGGGGDDGHSGAGGSGDAGKSSRLWAFWLWYMGCLDSNPIFTKAITSALLTLFGDVFCQLSRPSSTFEHEIRPAWEFPEFVVENAEKLDVKRTCIMTLLGFALTGPTLHFWYLTLHKVVTVGGPVGVGVRLALDQFLFSPTFIAVFISSLMTLEGKSGQIVAKLKQDLWPACLANWKLWIPAQAINFMLVPQKLQVGFANIVALAWNTYMSYQSHKKIEGVNGVQMEDLSVKSS